MDVSPKRELLAIPQKYHLKADRIGGEKVHSDPRRQDKLIAALVRKHPKALLLDAITILPQERIAFTDRLKSGRVDSWRDSDLETALSALPLPTMQETDIRHPIKTFAKFEGKDDLQRRMRRIVSFVTRGDISTPEKVIEYDLYNFVKNKCRNAVAYERKIPEILQQIDGRGLGIGNYMQALNEIGLALFGSQWVYLQQARLLMVPNTPTQTPPFTKIDLLQNRRPVLEASPDDSLPPFEKIIAYTEKTAKSILPNETTTLTPLETFKQEGPICFFGTAIALARRQGVRINEKEFARKAINAGILDGDKGVEGFVDRAKVIAFIEQETKGAVRAIPLYVKTPEQVRNPQPRGKTDGSKLPINSEQLLPTEEIIKLLNSGIYANMLLPVEFHNEIPSFEWVNVDNVRIDQGRNEVIYQTMWTYTNSRHEITLSQLARNFLTASQLGYGAAVWGWQATSFHSE